MELIPFLNTNFNDNILDDIIFHAINDDNDGISVDHLDVVRGALLCAIEDMDAPEDTTWVQAYEPFYDMLETASNYEIMAWLETRGYDIVPVTTYCIIRRTTNE